MITNTEVVDAWMQRLPATGRHIYTDGMTIWSYGRHIPIAKHFTHGRVLYNVTRFSNTTSKHQALVRYAMCRNGIKSVTCRDIHPFDNEKFTKMTLRTLIAKIPKCRKLGDRIVEVKCEVMRYVKYNEALGLKDERWVKELQFALSNLRGKALRTWAKNYQL